MDKCKELYTKRGPLSWIEIDGKNSLENFGLLMLKDSDRGGIVKKTNFFTIPYSNSPLKNDYSDISGEPIFEMRLLRYHFRIIGENQAELQRRYNDFVNFVAKTKCEQVYDSKYPDFFFTAHFSKASELEVKTLRTAEFTIEFNADPYRKSINYADCKFDKIALAQYWFNQNIIKLTADGTMPHAINVYNYADRPIRPMLMLSDGGGAPDGITVRITPYIGSELADQNGITVVIPYNPSIRLFCQNDFIIPPGRSMLTTGAGDKYNGYGLLTIYLYEEAL